MKPALAHLIFPDRRLDPVICLPWFKVRTYHVPGIIISRGSNKTGL